MTRIVAIRPEPGLASTIAAGRKLGLAITGAPLFEIRPLDWTAPDPASVDALLIGSANAIRHGGGQLEQFLGKPAYVVGKQTKTACEDAGIRVAATGEGGLQSVLDAVPRPIRLLRISGKDHVPLEAPEDVSITTIIAYESVALPFEPKALGEGEERTIVLLHSAVAAEHFASECDRLGLARSAIELAAFGPRIASSAGKGWADIHVAERPRDADLLAMVRGLCQ